MLFVVITGTDNTNELPSLAMALEEYMLALKMVILTLRLNLSGTLAGYCVLGRRLPTFGFEYLRHQKGRFSKATFSSSSISSSSNVVFDRRGRAR